MISAVLLVLLEAAMSASAAGKVVTYPGPKGEAASEAYAVSAGGKEVFVYAARVREEGLHRVACDYIAGMTDRYCAKQHQLLCRG